MSNLRKQLSQTVSSDLSNHHAFSYLRLAQEATMNNMLMVYLCISIAFFDKLYGLFCQGRAKDDVL